MFDNYTPSRDRVDEGMPLMGEALPAPTPGYVRPSLQADFETYMSLRYAASQFIKGCPQLLAYVTALRDGELDRAFEVGFDC